MHERGQSRTEPFAQTFHSGEGVVLAQPIITSNATVPIVVEQDVVHARQRVRQLSQELRFSLVDQTKLVTAASELARNAVVYGGGGKMILETLTNGPRIGLRLIFEDKGPGIADIDLALKDGYTSGGGLGLGLGGAKRLVNEFTIESKPGQGTTISITRWK